MPDTFDIYDKKHQQNLSHTNRQIKDIYRKTINKVSVGAKNIRIKGELFSLDDYPALSRMIENEMLVMRRDIYSTVVNSIKDSWDLSNTKNNVLLDKRVPKKLLPEKVALMLYDPNRDAMQQFIMRKKNGLNLSDRVWSSVEPLRNELEQAIGLGISEGKPAANLAKQIQKYLNEPDRLQRKVRTKEGKEKLSQSARDYKPGQGVYRSSYKNALRLARTETNIAYRTADFERWNKMPFVTGIEVRLSNNHPRYDICDVLVGVYPKDFKFTGWHPQCMCNAVPVMLDDDAYNKMEDLLLAGKPVTIPKKHLIQKPPAAFTKYLQQNQAKIDRLKSKPYWVSDNGKYVK